MTTEAIELLKRLQTLPERDQSAFAELFHQWEANHAASQVTMNGSSQVVWPDFMTRLREQWPEGTPGKSLSEIVDEGRGPLP